MIIPVQTGRGSWTYRGWKFHERPTATLPEYAIHGPNSNGKRARKIVFSYAQAVAYINKRLDAGPGTDPRA